MKQLFEVHEKTYWYCVYKYSVINILRSKENVIHDQIFREQYTDM